MTLRIEVRLNREFHDYLVMDRNAAFTDDRYLRFHLSGLVDHAEVDRGHAKSKALVEIDDPQSVVGGCKPDFPATILSRCLDRVQHERRPDSRSLQRAVERENLHPSRVEVKGKKSHDHPVTPLDKALLLVRIEGFAMAHADLAAPMAFDELGDFTAVGITDFGSGHDLSSNRTEEVMPATGVRYRAADSRRGRDSC